MRKLGIFLLLPTSVFLCAMRSDSLQQLLADQAESRGRVTILQEQAEHYRKINMDSAWHYADQAVDEARLANQPRLHAQALNVKAGLLMQDGRYEEGIKEYLQARDIIASQSPADSQLLFNIYYELVNGYNHLGQVRMAIAHYDAALAYAQAGTYRNTIKLNEAIARVYWQLEDYTMAGNFYQENLRLANQHSNQKLASLVHYDLSWNYQERHMPDSALFHAERALPGVEKLQDPILLSNLYTLLGESLLNQGDYHRGLDYFSRAEDLCFTLGYDGLICGDYAQVAYGYLQLGALEQALHYSEKALALLDDTQEYWRKHDALETLAAVYQQQGAFEKANAVLHRLAAVRDTIFDIENRKALIELEQKYKSRQQQAQIQQHETELALRQAKIDKQRTIILASVLVVALLILLAYAFWRSLRHKQSANNQLKELDTLKSRFFTNISHELRTPLALILGPLDQLTFALQDIQLKQELNGIRKNAKKLHKLADEVLELSKLEAGKLQLQPSDINFLQLLNRIFSTYESAAKLKRIDYKMVYQLPEGLSLSMDEEKLSRIVDNLLSNALKFTPEGGQVIMKVFREDSKIHIAVKDTGPGIATDDLPHIFKRYYQATSPGSSMQGGAGIGLALVSELSKLMKGCVEVESESGNGSCFIFSFSPVIITRRIPISKREDSDLKSARYSPLTTTPAREAPRILIVEDNPDMSSFIKKVLNADYHCRTATDGRQGLQLLESAQFDVVISDLMMPVMDGFQFLETIRKQPAYFREIPFIMLTARATKADKLKGLRLGVDDYLTKPFSAQELKARIKSLINNYKARKNWQHRQKSEEYYSDSDKELIHRAEAHVLQHLSQQEYNVGALAKALAYSPRQVERLIRRRTGFTPVAFIREIRLQKAYQLLGSGEFKTVADVSRQVGIESPSYFSRTFKKRFGIRPSELINKDHSVSLI